MRYRIVKRTDILYDKIPERRYWWVIQYEVRTILCLWIPFWNDLHYDNYAESIMTFDTLQEAEKYIKELKKITK